MLRKLIVFSSYPDYTDNSYGLFKHMIKHEKMKNYQYIWLVNAANIKILKEKMKKKYKDKNIKIIKKNSLKGFFYSLIANYTFFTHGLYRKIRLNWFNRINLWHGMPLKNIEILDGKEKVHYQKNMIATSEIFQKKICQCFEIEREKVLITGQPRNDMLFETSEFYKKMKIDDKSYNKIIIYLPTYRKSINGEKRIDGFYQNDKLGIIKMEEISKLNKNLLRNNNLMIIKLHPMDILQQNYFNQFSNIIILKTMDLDEMDEQLYPLLGSTDLLITDYSSVWVDYEILGKPIYFAMDDYEEYKKNRGFTIENLPELLPGDIIQDFETLLKKLENIPERIQKETGDMFNKHKDNKSCERLLKALGIL